MWEKVLLAVPVTPAGREPWGFTLAWPFLAAGVLSLLLPCGELVVCQAALPLHPSDGPSLA